MARVCFIKCRGCEDSCNHLYENIQTQMKESGYKGSALGFALLTEGGVFIKNTNGEGI